MVIIPILILSYIYLSMWYIFIQSEAREELFRKLSETRKIKNRSGEFNSSKPGNLFKKRENDREDNDRRISHWNKLQF